MIGAEFYYILYKVEFYISLHITAPQLEMPGWIMATWYPRFDGFLLLFGSLGTYTVQHGHYSREGWWKPILCH